MDATQIIHKASWFEHYAPSHWSLNIPNGIFKIPYTISRVKGGYTVTLNEEQIGKYRDFENAIVGAWEHLDEECGKALFGGGYEGDHTAIRA